MIKNSCDNNINYTIQENDITVKSIMHEKLNFSRRLAKNLELSGKIMLNGKISKLNKRVSKGDILSVEFKDEEDEYEAVNIPIDILYEDSDMIIVNKPPYIVVHPTKSHQNNCKRCILLFQGKRHTKKSKACQSP